MLRGADIFIDGFTYFNAAGAPGAGNLAAAGRLRHCDAAGGAQQPGGDF